MVTNMADIYGSYRVLGAVLSVLVHFVLTTIL